MMWRSSALVTGFMVVSLQSVGWKTGGVERAVSWQMSAIFILNVITLINLKMGIQGFLCMQNIRQMEMLEGDYVSNKSGCFYLVLQYILQLQLQ